MPAGIQGVFVGPDQRAWLVTNGDAPRDPDSIHRVLAAEFARPSPQLDGVVPILFEPGGRVWVRGVGPAESSIVAFDGKSWVEHLLAAGHRLIAGPPNHGGSSASANQFVLGTAFFVESQGIDSFDGTTWHYQEMTSRSNLPDLPRLFEEPDGRGIVAVLAGDKPVLVRWREGRWTTLEGPKAMAHAVQFAPEAGGIWFLGVDHRLHLHPYEGDRSARLTVLFGQLADRDAGVRERAEATILAVGDAAVPSLEQALAPGKNPEMNRRLRSILARLRDSTPPVAVSFGTYQLQGIRSLQYLPSHLICIAAEQVAEKQNSLGPGVIVLDPQGGYRCLSGAEVFRCWSGSEIEPPLQVNGTRIWLAAPAGSGGPASLLDLQTGKLLATLSDAAGPFHWLEAVSDDGTVFASAAPPGSSSGVSVAYRPGAPDDRTALKSEVVAINSAGAAVGSDGWVWTKKRGGPLAKFDGSQWHNVDGPDEDEAIRWFLPGKNGAMLVGVVDGYYFFLNRAIMPDQDLKALIKVNRPRFLAAFPAGTRSSTSDGSVTFATDAAGNFWLLEKERLSVFTGGNWIDADDTLKAAGSSDGAVRYISPVGDGTKVYISDCSPAGHGVCLLGEVRTGHLAFDPGPTCTDLRALIRAPRDRDGALWLPGSPTAADESAHAPRRLTERGVVGTLPQDAGVPCLIDADGNLWLQAVTSTTGTDFNVAREGKLVQHLFLAGADAKSCLAAGGSGSVYALTGAGLGHLTANFPGPYSLEKTWAIGNLPRSAIDVKYASVGCLMILTGGGDDSSLVLVRLPER